MSQEVKKFKRVLVANRGEIAIRVYRACAELGITSIGIYSKEDRYSMFRSKADEAYQLDPQKGPLDAYLDIENIIKIAKMRQVDAIHPGYGFLSENPALVRACEENGITFIGPDKEIMYALGDKISSKKMAEKANVPIIPGVEHAIKDIDEAIRVADMIGYPVMLKASNGGGGRGMRIINNKEEMPKEFQEAREESKKAFGDDLIFIEKYLKGPKHIEVQVLGDKHGNVVHLFDRDCSVQRRHQKVIEFAPAFTIPEKTRKEIFDASVRLCKEVGYNSVGTCEFLIDSDNNPYFIEMNTRIQVEHTVSEMITGIDLVQAQILVAEGYTLDSDEINIKSQDDIHCNGYSLQARVTTEDPANNFLPDTGTINQYRSGAGNGIRLDGGTAFTGAEILPYYDSLLVKVIAFDRTFEGTIAKCTRALREMRVRGVKTNMAFIMKLINNPVFKSGKCHTTFIEETPSLFDFTGDNDRAGQLMNFIGNKIVNENPTPKAFYEDRKLPKYDPERKIYGARDEFLKLGAEGFCQKILKEDKLYVTDTSMRDAHQSLIATRMRTKDLAGCAIATNQFLENGFSEEAWGGATFDTAYRFLKESPWQRLELLRKRMPNTLIQMLLRASNAVGYSNYPDNVVKEFIRLSGKNGVDVFRIFDSLNWIENMKMPIEEALKTGKIVEGSICYTGDITSPDEVKYTTEYYIKKAKELEALGCHIFAIKDMAGLLKPYAAKELITELKKELHIPIHLHTHDSTGNGVSTVLMAAEAGVDIVDLAVESMSSLTSQPSMNAVVEALKGTKRDTGLNMDDITELSQYYERQRRVYKGFESNMVSPAAEIYKYEIPGGQYSNLLAQVKEIGSADDFNGIKELYRQANNLLGNIVKVTPSSKAVGDFAIFMFKNGLTQDNILEVGKDLSYPASVVEYFMGLMGQPEGGFPKELQKIVLKGQEPLTERPGKLLEPVDLKAIEKMLYEKYDLTGCDQNHVDEKVISYAMYPKVYEEYLDHVEHYNDVQRLESHVYFFGLREGEETTLKVFDGKDIIIKYLGRGKADKEGYVTLRFDVDGMVRAIKILDKNLEVKSDRKLKADKNNPAHLGSTIPGTVGAVKVKEGDKVTVNMPLLTVEAMKLETTVVSRVNGTVDKIYVAQGDKVSQDDLLISFIIDEDEEEAKEEN
ncbi:pyruvate carboxylase [Acetitomaculum ruminis DSM 5522]|uniref:Pyruvate carboxylase n=1 Tax=Acetitomaculum ruminis DSM 5522 TaxID=1120918 RepID=A0A1I0YJA5_9FIRM|nr:pyruvate carboxylase [Acetitomaculum ruminis]SFB13515.1 pyruvate carboxylase [Acetitomaculum ruminis DSM 5522]